MVAGTKYILLAAFLVSFFTVKQEDIIAHEVVVNHPAFEKGDETNFLLKEKKISNDSSEYYLEVASVICVDHLCKIVPVKLVWNAYGSYLRYELEEHVQLEKGEGEPFTASDYSLLHQILKDVNSPYKDILYYEITHERIIGESQVDAISGATEVVLEKGDTVVGGAWTCFTLWHWANGEIVQEIKRISGAMLNKTQLLKNLSADVDSHQVYAINELAERKVFDVAFTELLLQQSPQASKEINKHIVNYIEQAPDHLYYKLMGDFYQNVQPDHRLLYLNSLLRTNKVSTSQDYQVYLDDINTINTFQEVNLILEVLDSQKLTSHQLNQVVQLLSHDNFLISRRAYWYLRNSEQSEIIEIPLQEYALRNKERL